MVPYIPMLIPTPPISIMVRYELEVKSPHLLTASEGDIDAVGLAFVELTGLAGTRTHIHLLYNSHRRACQERKVNLNWRENTSLRLTVPHGEVRSSLGVLDFLLTGKNLGLGRRLKRKMKHLLHSVRA